MRSQFAIILTFAAAAGICSLPANAAPPVQVASRADILGARDLQSTAPTIEMVFVVDTTGSMGGLIDGAKSRIWAIINDVMASPVRPRVRIGLVAYRDKGDAYVTQVTPISSDLDSVYAKLMDFQADGGGDTPENVRRALKEGVTKAGWSPRAKGLAQMLFLVGDAPPHDDYQEEPSVAVTAAKAVTRGLTVNTIQCGDIEGTRQVWEKIARVGEGEYFSIPEDGGVVSISTPYDSDLAALGRRIGGTFVAYGGGVAARASSMAGAARMERKVSAYAPVAAAADRAVNKAINSHAYDQSDLLQAVENGEVKVESLPSTQLPEELKNMNPEQRKAEIDRRLTERKTLRARILTLSKQRALFIADAAKKSRKGGSRTTGFDSAVSAALRREAQSKGIAL